MPDRRVFGCVVLWGRPVALLAAARLVAVALILSGLLAALFSMSVTAREPDPSERPAFVPYLPTGSTAMWVVTYPDDIYLPPGAASDVPYASCYRIGRCSAYDLYRFRDRPNRLTRLAPEAPHESAAWPPPITYRWALVLATPEENIVPEYRTASQVRDEYLGAGRPIAPN